MSGRIPKDANNNYIVLKNLISDIKNAELLQQKIISNTDVGIHNLSRIIKEPISRYTHVSDKDMKLIIGNIEHKIKMLNKSVLKSKIMIGLKK